MNIRKNILTTVIGTALFIGLSASSIAATTLKLSHNHNRDHAVHKAMTAMATEVKAETKGEVIIRIYPDAQLGTQRESMELLQNGALDLVKSNAAELEAFSSDYSAFNLPYLFRDKQHFYNVQEGAVGEDILEASRSSGFIGLTYYDAGARSFYAGKPINSPEDLKGLKVRVQPSPSAINMVTALGGNPTPLAYGELYTALQQGVVDAAENNIPSFSLSGHAEVSKFMTLDEHTMVPDVLVISTKAFDAMTPENQKIVKQAALHSSQLMKTLWAESETKERTKAEKMGVTFINPDKTPFMEAVQPIYQQLTPEITALVERIKAVK
ncbi:TRAP dicarboxylate transporter, DctP subunit [Psychromonas ingrahamii 37]|jgi:tripartite ATP-independent transporter DctP family solute receptor|uniref:TRAP dicarboxylate transporter, DctP subunit n=1 Tax=Psychromonas ingrahamii (strain DSM 17664 / CCUG 51855 / 37) TaxID=357804 RepID=A1SR91_PSYIN|nr:TRAP transporter substrate-binding protein DctP [Psychromonas ingrahamii]ABM02006.1 TRAP dicarboxylate transporter, DctP subunit [Psychromonas ingrahamii 37]